MNTSTSCSTANMERMHHLLASATHEASEAMKRWTNGQVSLTLDAVKETPLECVSEEADLGDELLTMIVLTLDGESGGTLILAFDEENGRDLAAALLNRERSSDPEWSAIEKSALNETGNILGCAYLNALTRFIGVELVPSPPYFIQDFGASVLEQALMEQAMCSETALICQTRFQRNGRELSWDVFFVPSPGMRERLDQAVAREA